TRWPRAHRRSCRSRPPLRAGSAFVAGLVLGAAVAGLVLARVRPGAPASAAVSAPVASTVPTPEASVAVTAAPPPTRMQAPPPGWPAEPGARPLGAAPPSPRAVPLPLSEWQAPEPDAPLGTRPPPPVLGDSTDAHLAPHALAPPADVPSLPSVSDLDRLRARQLLLPVQGYD